MSPDPLPNAFNSIETLPEDTVSSYNHPPNAVDFKVKDTVRFQLVSSSYAINRALFTFLITVKFYLTKKQRTINYASEQEKLVKGLFSPNILGSTSLLLLITSVSG